LRTIGNWRDHRNWLLEFSRSNLGWVDHFTIMIFGYWLLVDVWALSPVQGAACPGYNCSSTVFQGMGDSSSCPVNITIRDTMFDGCSATSNGGAISIYSPRTKFQLSNCEFSSCKTSQGYGGAVYASVTSAPVFRFLGRDCQAPSDIFFRDRGFYYGMVCGARVTQAPFSQTHAPCLFTS
jgi:hypothetical protein